MQEPIEIYIELLDEGLRVWRPVAARHIARNIYEILDDGTYDSDAETWMFPPSTWVFCQPRQFSGGQKLVAFARAQPSLIATLYAVCSSEEEAQKLTENFLTQLKTCAPVRLVNSEPYWKISAYYGFYFEFTPTDTYAAAFDCLVHLSPQGWSFSGGLPDRDAVWNPSDGAILLTDQVRWGHVWLYYSSIDIAEP